MGTDYRTGSVAGAICYITNSDCNNLAEREGFSHCHRRKQRWILHFRDNTLRLSGLQANPVRGLGF